MRRGACLLALFGFTVQNAFGADQFPAGTTRLTSSVVEQSPTGTSTPSPAKFSRTGSTTESSSDLKNYYKELFGEATPSGSSLTGQATPPRVGSRAISEPMAAKQTAAKPSAIVNPNAPATRPADLPVASPSAAPTAAESSIVQASGTDANNIIHAEYRGNLNSSGSIEQIAGERFSARPFPGLSGTVTKTASTEAAPASAPSKGEQAAISPAQNPPATGKGSVTFSRGSNANSAPATMSRPSTQRQMDSMDATAISAVAPSVKIEWKKQSDINVGQECSCHLLVTNIGQTTAQDVEVRASFPTSVRLINAVPAPSQAQSFLGWNFTELKPGETKTIEIAMVPLERGEINTRADVRFTATAEGRFGVAEPMLNIAVEGPKQVLLGEPASHLVTVSNPGTGIADRVQIEAILPEGLEHSRGQRLLMDLGNLNPGESRSVRLALAATKGGQHHLEVQAKSEAGLTRSAHSDVNVIAPNLAAGIQGPSLRYVGRQGVYTLAVTNDGAAATDNVQVRYKIPEGFEFVSADRGAQFDSATGLLTWFVGRLEKGQKSEIRTTLLARQLGEFKHMVRATSEHGTLSDAECVTSVEGTSSLSIAVKDTEDPVEVGSQTTYEIRVRNEGSASARAVGLTCEMPSTMTFVGAEGPAEFVNEGSTILFRALPEVAAGQTITFRVKVAAHSQGSLRFRALLSSESIDEPLTAEELTKFYGER